MKLGLRWTRGRGEEEGDVVVEAGLTGLAVDLGEETGCDFFSAGESISLVNLLDVGKDTHVDSHFR